MESVLTEQTEFENLVETILGALFGLFGLSVFRFTVQKIRRPKEKLAAKTKPSIVSLMEENLPVFTKKPELETRELSVSRYISGRCDLSGFRCTMRKELFSKQVAHTKSEMLSIESRIKQMEPIVTEKTEVSNLTWNDLKSSFGHIGETDSHVLKKKIVLHTRLGQKS